MPPKEKRKSPRSIRKASSSHNPVKPPNKAARKAAKKEAKEIKRKENRAKIRAAREKAKESEAEASSSPSKEEGKENEAKPSSPSKKKETHGSKHDSADAPAKHNASADHLPKKGQKVTWKAMPGWVPGELVEVLTKDKEVEGKKVKASKEDPRLVLKSHGPSGKIAVHKPSAVWFD